MDHPFAVRGEDRDVVAACAEALIGLGRGLEPHQRACAHMVLLLGYHLEHLVEECDLVEARRREASVRKNPATTANAGIAEESAGYRVNHAPQHSAHDHSTDPGKLA